MCQIKDKACHANLSRGEFTHVFTFPLPLFPCSGLSELVIAAIEPRSHWPRRCPSGEHPAWLTAHLLSGASVTSEGLESVLGRLGAGAPFHQLAAPPPIPVFSTVLEKTLGEHADSLAL